MASSNDAFQMSFTETPDVKRVIHSEHIEDQQVRRSPRLSKQYRRYFGKEQSIRVRGFLGCKRWTKVSVEDLGQVLRDVKDTANKTFNNVRSSVCSFPQVYNIYFIFT